MPEPLKNLYTPTLVANVAKEVKTEYRRFDAQGFQRAVFDNDWKQRELKQRLRHITQCLHEFLPADYQQALTILTPVASRFTDGFEYMFFPDFVELYGLENYELSVAALEWFTQFSTSEFAVRPFIVRYPKKMMSQMEHWAGHENRHVRRLASEGCRPRLPWAMALPNFKRDPAPVLRVLKKLKADDSEYVRRSVANNLNDIAKDHPDVVLTIAQQWKGKSANTDKLVRHACRTLLKNGEPDVLALFGFPPPAHVTMEKLSVAKQVEMGSALDFSFELHGHGVKLGKLRIEYAIEFVRTRGKTTRKVFRLAEGDFSNTSKQVKKSHSFRPITTRRYYPGRHHVAVIVNGQELEKQHFMLCDKPTKPAIKRT
ncbi:MAG: DNA alkylation repair protein [Gammaproteobacteria bacterium]|nr:DNA alkylation repair protein [Gammaproteobacteria bacterium]